VEAGFSPMRPGELGEAERTGRAFLVLRDADGDQRLQLLGDDQERVVVGRRAGRDIVLEWDDRVSRTHAQLERIGPEWAVVDDGLSRNGTS